MSPELSSIISDAIKILGPASLTAWLGYKAAKVQFDIKLREVDKSHEFNAREHLFQLFRERSNRLHKGFSNLMQSLGELVTNAAVLTEFEEDNFKGFRQSLNTLIVHMCNLTPMNVKVTKIELEKAGLDDIPEFQELDSCISKIMTLSKDDSSVPGLIQNTGALLEVYALITYCNDLVIDKQTEDVFSKYLERPKH
jgi:hypothetical protein